MGSTMHVIAIIDQKSRQNGIDYGSGRFRYEEGQFITFLFKVLPSARVTKYCHPFSEGDVVTLVGQFSYETVDKVEGFTGFTLNVSVATPFPIPSSGCWEPEEIPLSSPYLSFNTQPISGSLRQIENCQFIRTRSSINSGYTKRYIDSRFRIGYQIDNDKLENMANNWDSYSQFFISGFFLYVDNGEVHIEATEIESDPLTKKHGKSSNLINSNVPGVSPLAKNLARLLEQEKSSTSSSGIFSKSFIEPTSTKLSSSEKKPVQLRPLAPKSSSSSQNQPGSQSTEAIKDMLLKGLQAVQQLQGIPNPHMQLFSGLQHAPLSEQPSAEQMAELIADQGTSGTQPKLPTYSVWTLPGQETAIYNQRDKIQISPNEKSLTNQNDRDKSVTLQHQQELINKSPTQYVSPQNETSQIDLNNKNESVRSSRAESESGESMDLDQNKKSSKKSSSEDKSKSVRPTSRATLGNRFIVYEPKFTQESDGNKQDTSTGKRGRKSKSTSTRPTKKSKSKKNVNEAGETNETNETNEADITTTNQEEQVIDPTSDSPKNLTDNDSSEKPKNESEKSENTTLKDDEATNIEDTEEAEQ